MIILKKNLKSILDSKRSKKIVAAERLTIKKRGNELSYHVTSNKIKISEYCLWGRLDGQATDGGRQSFV